MHSLLRAKTNPLSLNRLRYTQILWLKKWWRLPIVQGELYGKPALHHKMGRGLPMVYRTATKADKLVEFTEFGEEFKVVLGF